MKAASERERLTAQLLERAVQLHRSGDRAAAQKIYRKILKRQPRHPDALNLLAMAAHQSGELDDAIRLMRKSVASKPGNPAAQKNLGNLMVESENFEEAVRCYRNAIGYDPGDATSYANLCVALRYSGQLEEAVDVGKKATRMDPQQMIAWYNLGNAYRARLKLSQAVKAYSRALELDPKFTPARDSLCRSTLAIESASVLGRRSLRKTRRAYQQWLEHEPENPVATFILSAINGEELQRAPDSVVKGLFDRTAGSFEGHLSRLEYRVPDLLEHLLASELEDSLGKLTVLDAGCGTGLCSPFLRRYASRLVGVDLSEGMLKKARQRGNYDNLIESELTDFLAGSEERFDLVVFADTLCYFGDLERVLEGTFGSLNDSGLLVFSVELAESGDKDPGFRLHPHGRYSHSRPYVESVLEKSGFKAISSSIETLRLEIGVPVKGLIVSARRRF